MALIVFHTAPAGFIFHVFHRFWPFLLTFVSVKEKNLFFSDDLNVDQWRHRLYFLLNINCDQTDQHVVVPDDGDKYEALASIRLSFFKHTWTLWDN